MNIIDFPRTGVDGQQYTRTDLEKFWLVSVKEDIESCLNEELRTNTHTEQKAFLSWLVENLETVLVASPSKCEEYIDYVNERGWAELFCKTKDNGKRISTAFGKRLLKCFGYEKYRETFLVSYSSRLNVKCCPYCNQHYTLCIEDEKPNRVGLAKFQFDHFFGKNRYPFLSMSMYNLIPSCPTCNHGKASAELPLKFNPYHQEIGDLFRFRVRHAQELFFGGYNAAATTSLVLEPEKGTTPEELEQYDAAFHIKAQYKRHGDVVEEAFYRAYTKETYLSDVYSFINGDSDLKSRLIHGTYIKKENIGKRPLSKLYQDIFRQAKGH